MHLKTLSADEPSTSFCIVYVKGFIEYLYDILNMYNVHIIIVPRDWKEKKNLGMASLLTCRK